VTWVRMLIVCISGLYITTLTLLLPWFEVYTPAHRILTGIFGVGAYIALVAHQLPKKKSDKEAR
jgi:hypothetical protein